MSGAVTHNKKLVTASPDDRTTSVNPLCPLQGLMMICVSLGHSELGIWVCFLSSKDSPEIWAVSL